MSKNLIARKINSLFTASNPVEWLKIASFSIIVPIALCSTSVNASQPTEAEILLSNLKKDGTQMVQIIKDINAEKNVTNEQISNMDLVYFSEALKIMNTARNNIETEFLEYANFLEPNFIDALDLNKLTDKNERKLLKNNLHEIEKQTSNIKKQIDKSLRKCALELDNIKAPAEIEPYLKEGFKKGLEAPCAYWNKYFELQFECLKSVHNIYKFLDSHDKQFYLEDDQLVFNNDADVVAYNDLTDALLAILEQQDHLVKHHQEQVESKIKNLETLIK